MILTVSMLSPLLSVNPYRCPVEPTTVSQNCLNAEIDGIPIIFTDRSTIAPGKQNDWKPAGPGQSRR